MADNMQNSEDIIPNVAFANNSNERTPCVLVLDCSGSMRGEPIKQLNAGLAALEKELKEDTDAGARVQLLIIKACGKDEAVISSDWVDAMDFTAPVMEAGGLTPKAILTRHIFSRVISSGHAGGNNLYIWPLIFHSSLQYPLTKHWHSEPPLIYMKHCG